MNHEAKYRQDYDNAPFLLHPDVFKLALDVQNAVNLSGVVRTFAGITPLIWDESNARERMDLSRGTDWVNHHPVIVLFAYKVASLAGIEPMGEIDQKRYNLAKTICEEVAELAKLRS